jgi:hypothetical protein
VAIRYQTYDDEDDEAVADALDGGAGTWTRLQLIEMDLAFCAAMHRAHPELELHEQPWRSAAYYEHRAALCPAVLVVFRPPFGGMTKQAQHAEVLSPTWSHRGACP